MLILFLIITVCLLCSACGVKSDPEYKAKDQHSKNIYIA